MQGQRTEGMGEGGKERKEEVPSRFPHQKGK